MYPQKYPIGESSFRAISEGGWLYVDQLADMYRLVNENTYHGTIHCELSSI